MRESNLLAGLPLSRGVPESIGRAFSGVYVPF